MQRPIECAAQATHSTNQYDQAIPLNTSTGMVFLPTFNSFTLVNRPEDTKPFASVAEQRCQNVPSVFLPVLTTLTSMIISSL